MFLKSHELTTRRIVSWEEFESGATSTPLAVGEGLASQVAGGCVFFSHLLVELNEYETHIHGLSKYHE